MAKFYGEIGYAITMETRPGIYEPSITSRMYSGEFMRNLNSRVEPTGNVNDNIILANTISILADPFAYENFHNIKYVEFMGTKWKVTSVEVQYPRLLLTTGGIYNG